MTTGRPPGPPAILALTRDGAVTAGRVRAALPDAEIFSWRGRVPDGVGEPVGDPVEALRALFRAGRPIIALCAAGIVIRALAPLLGDKRAEPPVLAVDETGASVVPLLGGHRGGNGLARAIAAALGGHAALTTASDVRLGLALDDPPPGWRLANPEHAKGFMAGLLEDPRVRLDGTVPPFLETARWTVDPAAARTIRISHEIGQGREAAREKSREPSPTCLVYRPAVLALGVGCARLCPAEELAGLVSATLEEAGLAPESIALVASLDLKEDEPAVLSLADSLSVKLRVFPADRLEQETPRLANPSAPVFAEVGCHGVAEAACLAAAGPAGRLLVPKRKTARATCAVALAPLPIDPDTVGRPRGHLAVVGLGPGAQAWRTTEATALIRQASDLVGYRLYLDLIGPSSDNPDAQGKAVHAYALGEETDRVRQAIALAAEGRRVALISSGDPGIYAMAALVHEELENAADPAWRRIAVTIAPGVSAMQAAAARIGAPLGHDFCAISLSDLLTPWATIEARLQAAAQGDFVVALYNPVSQRRDWQLGAALAILGAHRPADTPVVLAAHIGRSGETVRVVPLAEVRPAEIDMLTLVLVGASATRRYDPGDGRARVYTPRGYAGKTAPQVTE